MGRHAFLGLGSNVGDSRRHLRDAISLLRAAPGVNFIRSSSVYKTEPIGITDQPRFLNMVVEVELDDEIDARRLLALAKEIEDEVGRKHRQRWGPREIDVDVLLVGEERVREGDLEVPHPRMWERAFVMVPLAELAPELKGPGGATAARTAARLRKGQTIHAKVEL